MGAELDEPTGNALIQLTVSDVDAGFQAAVEAGGRIVARPRKLPWGSYSGFIADPDGHILEFYRWS